MGKNKFKFNKKQAVRFTLVPGFDQNGKPITHFRAVQTKKTKVNPYQREKLIQQISDEVYDQIQINGKKVGQNQIPAFVLEQIRGRKGLVYNQKNPDDSMKGQEEEGDLYDIVDAQDYENDEFGQVEQEWVDQKDIIDEQQGDQQFDQEQGEWEEDDGQIKEQTLIDVEGNAAQSKKPFKLNQEDFPILNKVNHDGRQYELTEAQIKLLDVLIPENYENFTIKGLKFQKYDEFGLPLSQKSQYQEFYSTGKQGIVDSFSYVPDKPTSIYDTDLKPSQMTGDLRQVQDALNFEGQQEAYEQLEDDFFAKLVKSQIQLNKKQKKERKEKKKTVSKDVKPQPKQIQEMRLPKILEQPKQKQNQENIFAKYDQLDEDMLEEQITDEMLQRALDDFQNNLQPENKDIKKMPQQEEQQMQQKESRNNASMNYSQIQKNEDLFGKDGELDWRCLSKKQKKQYMKTKIIREFYDQVRQREIQEKLVGKRNVTAEELHLKTRIRHLTFQEDHVMRKVLEQDAQKPADFSEDSSYVTSSEQQDIVQYHQRTSVISSGLNEVSEISKRRPKRKKDDDERSKELDELSATMSKLKASSQKRDRTQTKQERKIRKEKQKQLKKEKRQIKKQFAQKFSEQRRKHMKMTKPTDSLHKVSYVKII